jgi:hypothetical protein
MGRIFWGNTIWYIMLMISSVIIFGIALNRSQYKKLTIAYFFSLLGFLFFGETILTVVLRAYTYHPGLFSDPILDAVFGNYFSQISIAATAVLICVFDLSYIWVLAVALIYYLLDKLFVGLGIYEHFWYKSVYTLIILVPLFGFIKRCYRKISGRMGYAVYYFTLFFGVFSATSLTIILILRLLGVQIFHGNLFANPSLDHTETGILYQIVQINYLMFLSELKWGWVKKAAAFAFFFVLQYLLNKSGIVYIAPGWFLTVTAVDSFVCFAWVTLFKHFLCSKYRKNIPRR